MGIDIRTVWKNQTKAERDEQAAEWLNTLAGRFGYLREAYHGEPYATQYLCAEAFDNMDTGDAEIPARVLRERLPETLKLVAKRERTIYQLDEKSIKQVKQRYRDFVELCERKERETGEPALISADY